MHALQYLKIPPPHNTSQNLTNPHTFSTKTTIFICLAVFAFLLALNLALPLVGDDYLLLKNSNGFQSLIHSYFSWNARLYELLYGAFIVRLSPYIFDFFNAILGTIFVLGGKEECVRKRASNKPNLLNVAVTRAKERLIMVGIIKQLGKPTIF